jgi:hypothetical protein
VSYCAAGEWHAPRKAIKAPNRFNEEGFRWIIMVKSVMKVKQLSIRGLRGFTEICLMNHWKSSIIPQ